MGRLVLLLVLGCLAVLPACTLYGRSRATRNHWDDATGGESLERSFWEDVKNKEWDRLSRHIAGNYVAVTPQEERDRAAALAHLKTFDVTDYSLGNLRTELNGNTFVVTYQLTLAGKIDGQPIPPAPVRVMTVWQKQAHGWVAIARSEMASN